MEIVIPKPKKPDKQFDARIVNKQRFHLDRKGLRILQNIKINNGNNDMLIGIKHESWTKSGVKAAGWMSKHVLWNKPTLQASVVDIHKQFESLKV